MRDQAGIRSNKVNAPFFQCVFGATFFWGFSNCGSRNWIWWGIQVASHVSAQSQSCNVVDSCSAEKDVPPEALRPSNWEMMLSVGNFGRVLFAFVFAIVGLAAGGPTDYASVREEVVKSYSQQAEEMAQALEVLQAASADTSEALRQIEASC